MTRDPIVFAKEEHTCGYIDEDETAGPKVFDCRGKEAYIVRDVLQDVEQENRIVLAEETGLKFQDVIGQQTSPTWAGHLEGGSIEITTIDRHAQVSLEHEPRNSAPATYLKGSGRHDTGRFYRPQENGMAPLHPKVVGGCDFKPFVGHIDRRGF